MKYIDWLKTNPSKGYYWVKYSKDSEPSIDSFEEWYDRAGNIEIRFDCEPEYVLGPVLSYQEHLDIKKSKDKPSASQIAMDTLLVMMFYLFIVLLLTGIFYAFRGI